MQNDSKYIKCFSCGQTHHLDNSLQNQKIICTGCGKAIQPLIFDQVCEDEKRGFHIILGFFAIVALIGAMGGVMLVNNWNFWITFAIVGGMIYLIGKIFIHKYKIAEIEENIPENIKQVNDDIHTTTNFDRLVLNAINDLPQKIRKRLSDVSIVVEDRPDLVVLEKLKLKSNRVVLGLFEGVPLNRKSVWQSGTLPEKITLYQKNIEAICQSDDEIKQRIKKVVRHEVAHFVGFTEEQVKRMGY